MDYLTHNFDIIRPLQDAAETLHLRTHVTTRSKLSRRNTLSSCRNWGGLEAAECRTETHWQTCPRQPSELDKPSEYPVSTPAPWFSALDIGGHSTASEQRPCHVLYTNIQCCVSTSYQLLLRSNLHVPLHLLRLRSIWDSVHYVVAEHRPR